MPPDKPSDVKALGDRVVRILSDIGAGRCDITDEMIAQEPDDGSREVLIGLLMLSEDLKYQQELRSRATEERNQLTDALREAVAVRDRFLSIAAHELRTPLTALKLQMELLKQTLPKEDVDLRPVLGAQVPRIEKQILRLSRLVEELLDVSRVVHGQVTMHPEPLDLADAVQEVIERLQNDRHDLVFRRREAAPGRWDPLRIDQVVSNLVTNALRYGEETRLMSKSSSPATSRSW